MGEFLYTDRFDAGRKLALRLSAYAGRHDIMVLALPRGGVPVAFEVARALGAPLEAFLVRKVGVPGHAELAMGALASGGVEVRRDDVIRDLGITPEEYAEVAVREGAELRKRESRYRNRKPDLQARGRTLIVVDDGLATGSTMRAAVLALRRLDPARIVVAVPVGARESCREIAAIADEVICAASPRPFLAVGRWYRDFSQTSDGQVRDLLSAAESPSPGAILPVRIPVVGEVLYGDLTVPPGAGGIIVFAHGSGSGRHSPRNRFVARGLAQSGFATLLLDLLTEREAAGDLHTGAYRFDIDLLAFRLVRTVDWLGDFPATSGFPVGCFGASTGGGAALVAASQRPERIRAVVSRGGRPDMAGDALEKVAAPTLLIVGGRDPQVLRLNREALDRMACERKLEIIPEATHLFEEPGALEKVADLAAAWFGRLRSGPVPPA